MTLQERENRRTSPVSTLLSVSPQNKSKPKTRTKNEQEARSKRVQILLTPTLFDEVKQKCEQENISFCECVNRLLQSYIEN